MRRFYKSAAFILTAAVIVPSAASQDLTLANLTLGMTQSDVEAKMSETGYEPFTRPSSTANFTMTRSFAQKVKGEQGHYIRSKDKEGLDSLTFSKNEREFVTVKFEQYPSGDFVKYVNYLLKDKTIGADQFRERVLERYGPSAGYNWLGDQAMSQDNISSKEHLILNGFNITLIGRTSASDYDAALKAAIPKSTNETSF